MIASTVWADNMLYIRTYNRPGVTKADDAGRSKKGDIVDIYSMPHTPTETAMKEWAFVVVPSINETVKQSYLSSLEEREEPKAYRKHKIDVDGLSLKVGEIRKLNSVNELGVSEKTQADFDSYELDRIVYNFKRPFIRIAKRILPNAYAAASTSKICAVGDNCTDEDYNTLTAWEDAKDGVLDGIQTAECYDDDGAITEAGNLTVNGSTTDASNYMKITAPVGERHSGTMASGAKIDQANTGQFKFYDDFLEFSWLVFEGNDYTGTDNFELYYATNVTIKNNVIRGGRYMILRVNDPCSDIYIYNNIIMSDDGEESDVGIRFENGNGSGNLVYNNTIINCDKGIDNNDTTEDDVTAINNIVQLTTGNTACYEGNFSSNSTNNLGDDATAPEYGTYYDNVELTFSGAGDYHLDSTDTDAIDGGVDLGTTYAIDIDGHDRDDSTTWDLGADEIVEVAGAYSGWVTIITN